MSHPRRWASVERCADRGDETRSTWLPRRLQSERYVGGGSPAYLVEHAGPRHDEHELAVGGVTPLFMIRTGLLGSSIRQGRGHPTWVGSRRSGAAGGNGARPG